ncbi:MAG TPA: TMEM175 family protein [Allosphingosinicella sp.]
MADRKTDHTLERLVFFSDAVFAIAITLLVIDIHAPDLPRTASDADHWAALAHLGSSFAGYIISFALVGAFWMSHHRYFALTAHYRPRILPWNMGLLATIAFMPFTTAYLSANMDQRVPALVYCGALFAAASFNMVVSLIATAPPMVDEAASSEDIRNVRVRGLTLVLGSATAFLLALLFRDVGQYGLLSLPFFRILLARIARARRGREAPATQGY